MSDTQTDQSATDTTPEIPEGTPATPAGAEQAGLEPTVDDETSETGGHDARTPYEHARDAAQKAIDDFLAGHDKDGADLEQLAGDLADAAAELIEQSEAVIVDLADQAAPTSPLQGSATGAPAGVDATTPAADAGGPPDSGDVAAVALPEEAPPTHPAPGSDAAPADTATPTE